MVSFQDRSFKYEGAGDTIRHFRHIIKQAHITSILKDSESTEILVHERK
jgi:hypothetical protein